MVTSHENDFATNLVGSGVEAWLMEERTAAPDDRTQLGPPTLAAGPALRC